MLVVLGTAHRDIRPANMFLAATVTPRPVPLSLREQRVRLSRDVMVTRQKLRRGKYRLALIAKTR